MISVKIETEFIKLDQFLKWVGLVLTGADAKILISNGLIRVNGEVELRRGRKLRSGDIVELDNKEYQIE
ncbi:MAG TPA: RNA-binding S4 domain-containing protein [Acetivibrio sp.]|nr:RNA-binding S4 domain-containing protein [Clostridium sp.]HOQ36797.1 RNA-binding S4 domain-containing protein [Acetivibrio sp.]HPT90422.1 RNA-binding S4 domain-containing protein [Acetivibrio sp.]HQA56520.1 RNA-binding S4 domain-containing protein [Acetivibrio sp.]